MRRGCRSLSTVALRFRAWTARAVTLLNREPSTILAVAAAIGVGTGLVVIVFYRGIDFVQRIALQSAVRTALPAALTIPLLVGFGVVVSRLLVRWGARGSTGENIPDVMHAVAVRGGRLDPAPVAVKTIASAIVIGTGGSVGPEGPVVVAGAAAGSRIGRWFRASPERLKTLVGAGSAAGIAAAFNAPIAGVLFAVEKILGAFGAHSLAPVVVASVLASVVGRAAFGDDPVIAVPTEYGVGLTQEIALYAALGIVTGGQPFGDKGHG
jgi:CIC family chloride channel protein